MAKIIITGGTGLVGTALSNYLLAKGHEFVVFSRSKKYNVAGSIKYAQWDVENNIVDEKEFAEADIIVNLAGAGVADKRWTKKRKEEIKLSRVKAAELIVNSLNRIPNRVQAVINASAIGWYGPDSNPLIRENGFIETDKPANDYLGTTCQLWEKSIAGVKTSGKRLVIFRIGIVMSNQGGALKQFLKPLRAGIAAILGSGKQIISWIAIEDLCRAIEFAIENKNMEGVYNAVSPHPISNKKLTLVLAASVKHHFFTIKVPSFLLKITLGEMSIEVLKSTTVNSEKIQKEGFKFQYPTIHHVLTKKMQ